MAVPDQGLPDRVTHSRPERGPRRGPSEAPAAPGRTPPDRTLTQNASFAVRARVSVSPWTDQAFARDVREVMRTVSLSEEVVLGTGNGAILAERLLRERGYRHARVVDARTPDEAMRRIAHWRVLRDGNASDAPA